jgi:hypothetical protein
VNNIIERQKNEGRSEPIKTALSRQPDDKRRAFIASNLKETLECTIVGSLDLSNKNQQVTFYLRWIYF